MLSSRIRAGQASGRRMRLRARVGVHLLESRVTPAAGQLDPSFGTGGLATTRFSGPSAERGRATDIDSLDRLVVAGSTNDGIGDLFAISRYTPSGALDTSFGGTGTVTIKFSSSSYAFAVAVDSIDRIVVGGNLTDGSGSAFAVARLTSSGTLDTGFDGDGKQTITFSGGNAYAYGVALDSMDRVLIAGEVDNFPNSDFALARLSVNGALDTSFDADGRKTLSFGAYTDVARDIALDSTGRIVVAGYANTGSTGDDFAVARLTDSGAFDPSFDFDGKQSFPINSSSDQAYGVAIDSLGRVILGGNTLNGSYEDFAVVRLTATGDFDFSFGIDSIRTFDFDNNNRAIANDTAVDAQDRVVIAGYIINGSNYELAVARLTVTGELDAEFDSDGKRTITFGAGVNVASGVAIDSMNRVMVGGYTRIGTTFDFAVARFTVVGDLDSSFDVDGKQTTDFNAVNSGIARAVVIDSFGRTIVAGYTSNGSNNDFAITRYTPTGALDTAFGGGGKVMIDFAASDDYAYGVALDSANRVLIAGTSNSHFAVARLTIDGQLDSNFDGDGKKTISMSNLFDAGYAVTVDSQDRVIIAGYANSGVNTDYAIARLTPTGAFDNGFDSDGKKLIDFASGYDAAYSVAVDSMDRVVVAGYSSNSLSVARLTPSGALDTSFDTDGKQTVPAGEFAYGVAVDSLNRIVVAGYIGGANRDFLVARLTVTGALDVNFDSDGKQMISFGPSWDTAYAVAIDSQNRVVVAGDSFMGSNIDMAVARLTAAGALDPSFDTDGKQIIDLSSAQDTAYGVAVDTFDRVLIGGIADSNGYLFAAARLTGDTQPPHFTSIAVNDGSPQRSMVTSLKMTFDSKVNFVGAAAGAFQLNRQSDNAAVSLSATVDVSGTFATLTFTSGAVNLGGSLADGRFTLKILASQFSGLGFDGNGDAVPGDDYLLVGTPANGLFRLFGDADGDGAVAASDFILLRQFFNGSSVAFDFNNDGSVSASDFVQFRMRFGGSV